ncbi:MULTISPECIES: NAD(P)/FAD-dependent oxidoreductase [Mycobacterium]|uniref:Flavoprotein reductase n=1 Tax=Mycobacterium gordonae TaxID=1778 RepID=A0A1A6BJT1_MYCGO|nr:MULTISPECIES: FAD/NAD(P)-binding oxidoreductase [Mycobacterium]MBI2698285.1 NAD(P)/FAD-dependent oxidoreductase [Mycobacterium sp.]MCQ4364596.1 NAD(P)/FAD-dependent oxidoreductase [Mycobacterium gordonae]MCV7008660.1 NAD(P)/FAD-dependent oxidoreductase [Mycobacterium gordonae]OBS02585.1 flavoprotein reductase [Mycobacterium gordonae]ODR17502.1 flavoprotein reductase [Mycobacterium gordonae]
MTPHVVILGAGFGGLELATRLSESLADHVRLTLIDSNDCFSFGFSKLDVLLGKRSQDEVRMPYASFASPGVEFRQEVITAIDPENRYVRTEAGSYQADILVVALGAQYDPAATPGFAEDGYEYYSLAGAERLCAALPTFQGGNIVISVLGEPYKCPPAPFEAAFLLEDYFATRGLGEQVSITVTGFMGAPVPVAKEVSEPILQHLTARGITFVGKRTVCQLNTADKVAQFAEGGGLPYDLFIGIPVHRAPKVVADSKLAPDGWIPVEKTNLATRFSGVYALGDVAAAFTAKAGTFAERAAQFVADNIIADLRGTPPPGPYDGAGDCFMEFGRGEVAKMHADFLSGPTPTGVLRGPSTEFVAEKAEFARTRQQRWFAAL